MTPKGRRGRRLAARFAASVLLAAAAGLATAHAEDASRAPLVIAQATPDPAAEKEAFDAAKELGTVDAWNAFLKSYSTGFRADLARAYIAKLGQGTPAPAAGAATATPPVQTAIPPALNIPPVQPTPPPVATKLGLIDLGPGIAPWQNGTVDVDDGSRRAYAAQVAGNGMELIATCVPPQTKKESYALALMLRENPRGVYPEFDTRLREGIDGSPAVGADFRQIALRFDGGSLFEASGRIFDMTGELEITLDGKPVPASSKILESMMGGRTMTVLADPFSGTFQLANSRPALCSVLAACGAKISACKGISAPKVSSKPVKPTTQTKVFVPQTTTQGYIPPQGTTQPKQFVPGPPQGGATLVIQQTATGSCPDPKTQIRNAAGQCVCNVVTTLVNGTCVKACVGATRDLNGNCQCPAGQTYHPNGYCIDGTNEAALKKTVKAGESQTCPDGRLRDVSGACLNLCSGERLWNGQKCIMPAEAKNYYCRDLGLPEKGAEDGSCKAAPSGGLTVNLVPGTGTKTQGGGGGTQGDGVPIFQLFGLPGGITLPQGGTTQPKIVCTGGQVPQANGTCACPSGQQLTAGKCVATTFTATKQVACINGYQLGADNKCTCPSGQIVNGQCVAGKVIRQETIVITCTGGQVPQANGTCACPSGQQLTAGKCVAAGGQTVQPQGIIPGAPGGLNLMLSDRRMKTDVSEVATLPNGIRLYAFRYLADDTMRVGVMAQDLLADARTRAAVHTVNEVYRVDYAALGLRMATLAEWRERGVAAVLRQQ